MRFPWFSNPINSAHTQPWHMRVETFLTEYCALPHHVLSSSQAPSATKRRTKKSAQNTELLNHRYAERTAARPVSAQPRQQPPKARGARRNTLRINTVPKYVTAQAKIHQSNYDTKRRATRSTQILHNTRHSTASRGCPRVVKS